MTTTFKWKILIERHTPSKHLKKKKRKVSYIYTLRKYLNDTIILAIKRTDVSFLNKEEAIDEANIHLKYIVRHDYRTKIKNLNKFCELNIKVSEDTLNKINESESYQQYQLFTS